MVVTTSYMTDRLGVATGVRVTPDSVVDVPAVPYPGWPFATDHTASVARAWLMSRPACRAR